MTRLTDNDLYATELMALFQTLRFLGKKVDQPGTRDHLFRLAKKQLDMTNNTYNQDA